MLRLAAGDVIRQVEPRVPDPATVFHPPSFSAWKPFDSGRPGDDLNYVATTNMNLIQLLVSRSCVKQRVYNL